MNAHRNSILKVPLLSGPWSAPENQGNNEEYEEDDKQHMRNTGSRAGYAAKSKDSGDDGNNEEGECPA